MDLQTIEISLEEYNSLLEDSMELARLIDFLDSKEENDG